MNSRINNTRVPVPTTAEGGESCYDLASLNPTGRLPTGRLSTGRLSNDGLDLPEATLKTNKNNKNRLLSCTETTYIGTLNTRTLRTMERMSEMVHLFEESGVEILAVQEHRVVHDEPVRMKCLGKNCYFVSTSAWRNSVQASVGGVGFFMTRKAYSAIRETVPVSPRILRITFNGNPRATLISVYSPTESGTVEAAETFHNELRDAVHQVAAHDFLQVLGDLNAHIARKDENDCGWYLHGRTNRNGKLLRDTALECDLLIMNTQFRKKEGKLWTHLSDGTLTKSQIDFILVRRKWRKSVKDVEPYSFFRSLGSDHRLVLAEVRLSLRTTKAAPRKILYDWDAFKVVPDLQEKYTVQVRNRFGILCRGCEEEEEEEVDVSVRFGHLTTAIAETTEAFVPKRKKKKVQSFSLDHRVCSVREKLQLAEALYHQRPTEDHRLSVGELKTELDRAYLTAQEEDLIDKIRRVETAAEKCKSKESWAVINEITGRKKGGGCQIRGKGPEERMENWLKHFRDLLGRPPEVEDEDVPIETQFTDLSIGTSSFTLDELRAAKKKIKEGKACGDDGIPPEVLKRCDLDEIVLGFCNEALESGLAPDQWRISNIIPVPKKGDLTDPGNYRGISLTSIVAKTLNRMILNRIRAPMEEVLGDTQNGFREGRSTTSHILALRRILEGARAKNLPAVMVFIDFKKAFDSLHRGILMKILRAYGVPARIVDLINLLYINTRGKVITPDGDTDLFEILAGVLQGDTLAPYLFIIAVDYCMRQVLKKHPDLGFTVTPARSRRIKAVRVSDVEFADDIALSTNNVKDAEILLKEVERVAATVGLRMNEGKTKYLVRNIEAPDPLESLSGGTIELVDDFSYLGSKISDTESDVNMRKGKAWGACHSLRRIWKSDLKKPIKIRIFTALVESVFLYGSETWTMTKRLVKMVDGCYTRMLRMALDVNQYTQRITNNTLYGALPKLSSKIAQRRLRLSGHAQRHPELTLNKVLLWEPTHGVAKRGRPYLTFVDNLRADTGLKSVGDISRLMEDRELWRSTVHGAREHHPP